MCLFPGCDWPVTEKHRILPGRDGGHYYPINVARLCPNHHERADAGVYPESYLRYLVTKRCPAKGLLLRNPLESLR